MKIKFLFLLIVFSCGTAYALPQDWPCFGIEVEKYKVIKAMDDNYKYSYKGEKNGYFLDIDLSGYYSFPTSFADCGTAGCFGTITEKSTGRRESLKFFCEDYNDDYTKVVCHVGFGEEVIFDGTENGNYVVHYCSDDKQKTLHLNLSDCNKCHCTMYWYDGTIKNTTGEYNMACKKEKNRIHCFTYSGYETWRGFQNKDDDFKNCVNLEF